MKKQDSLTAQFIRLLTAAGLGCLVLFAALQGLLVGALGWYDSHSDLRGRETGRLLAEFQDYVTAEGLASTDAAAITGWVGQRDFTLLELYRDQVLVYSSFVPDRADVGAEGRPAPFYDWMPRADITFADGQLQALLYYDPALAWGRVGTTALMVLCVALFLLIFLLGCRRIVRYICLLSGEIQAMEGGDLSHPVTIRGRDELTALASCLDAMRLSLRRQHQEEAEAAARVKGLITEMSHDLRTPLTTLLLYTEIVAGGRYQSRAQLEEYLGKIDAKARQIKQLSDNLFEYALVTRDTAAALDPPAPFCQVFEEPLADFAAQLDESGFGCLFELEGDGQARLRVCRPYIRRIIDNIASNILKYADPAQPAAVRMVREGGKIGLAFSNAALPPDPGGEGTKVGLVSVGTMMEKMHAEVRVSQTDRAFCITLLFPIADPIADE
ncbi:MAG TPA: HAMP domain-containing protein [Candidatus Faecalibacterium faecipullorum]|uniref:histidine kinase n=1 Tax=Candidatus Faecalibacterium faecipullorum TaxID=2838578 RepID=A0A9D2MF94_9FIRM|nr:HAMP domain-containing protein [Candidatus Faecalibacterium faecipullorum]